MQEIVILLKRSTVITFRKHVLHKYCKIYVLCNLITYTNCVKQMKNVIIFKKI